AVDDRGPLAGDEVDALVTVEGLGEHLASAPDHRHERPVNEAESVKERQVHEDRVLGGDPHSVAPVPRVAGDAVVVGGSPGGAGGAPGVEDAKALPRNGTPGAPAPS